MRILLLALALLLAACASAPKPKPDCHTVPPGTPCDGVANPAPASFTIGSR